MLKISTKELLQEVWRGAVPVKSEDLKYAIRNASKEINLPYQILHIARRCLHTGDYRGCVLNSASSIEIPFNNAIDKYMKDKSIPEELVKCKALKVNGIYQSAELCKNLGIDLKFGDDEKKVMKMRNDVIHKGVYPSYQEAYDCYFKAMAFLKSQNVGMFE